MALQNPNIYELFHSMQLMRLGTKLKLILTNPVGFFRQLREDSFGAAFGFFALFSFILMALNLVIWYANSTLMYGLWSMFIKLPLPQIDAAFFTVATIIGYIAGLGLTFVSAGILHAYLRIFGGKASYTQTYQLSVYASTPTYLFNWIPFIGVLAGIWSLVLAIL